MSIHLATKILLFSFFFLFNSRGAQGLILRISRLARHPTITFVEVNFGEYVEKARAMVGGADVPCDSLVNIAANLLNLEYEKSLALERSESEKRLALEHAECEKRLALEHAESEKQKALLAQKAEFNETILRHYYSKKLSFVSLRNVLESLFVRVVDLYRSGSNDLVKVIDEADKGGEFKKNAKRVNPKMTTVNKILLNKAVWSVVAANLGMSATIKFPDLGSSLIYGVLSSEIHNPDLDRVIVSNKADETRKVLFKALANMSKKEYIEYDEEWSSLADETENKSNKL